MKLLIHGQRSSSGESGKGGSARGWMVIRIWQSHFISACSDKFMGIKQRSYSTISSLSPFVPNSEKIENALSPVNIHRSSLNPFKPPQSLVSSPILPFRSLFRKPKNRGQYHLANHFPKPSFKNQPEGISKAAGVGKPEYDRQKGPIKEISRSRYREAEEPVTWVLAA